MKLSNIFIATLICVSFNFSFAQDESRIQTSAVYLSDTDDLLNIKTIAVLPPLDNTSGIYSRQLEADLKDLVSKNHRFQLSNSQYSAATYTPDELEQNIELVKSITQNIQADAVIASQVFKTSDALSLHMTLFLKADGKAISREIVRETKSFDYIRLKAMVVESYNSLIKKIPYDGTVLSRTGNLVTVNLGSKDKIKPGQELTVALILKTQRHPKLNFIIHTERDVLGKLKVQKVDETISFAEITQEKTIGAIRKGNKITGIEFVNYASTEPAQSNSTSPDKLFFGENPKEWKPSDPPTFGKLGASLGFGQMRYNTKLNSAGSLNGEDSFYPTVLLTGQLWMTRNWLADLEIEQGIASINNPLSGSSPKDLSVNISNFLLSFGYNFLVQDDFFGPSILISLGLGNYGADVDSSAPLSFTSTRYKGIFLGIKGTLPVSMDQKWNMGASIKYFINSDLTESPQGSGSPDNTITHFSLIGFYQKNTKMRFTGALDFSLFSTQFSGAGDRTDPATDASLKFTVLRGGVEFLF